MPAAMVRLSAGRLSLSDEAQALCLLAGANSVFMGERLLTTPNPQTDLDRDLLERMGMRLRESAVLIIPACYSCSLPPISPSVSNMSVQKILALEDLLARRDRLRQENKRTVFTNGCFDLLHPGHVDYLSRARQMGDALIVGVNSDRSVRELKGPLRPILTLDERTRLLSGLDSVDYITVFDEDTPHRLIAALLPDVLVKGGDWTVETIVGRQEVEAAGGRVVPLPYLEGQSSTRNH